jgi:hypothetical protein
VTSYYISGRMRGMPDYNRAEFNAVEAALIAWCYGKVPQDGDDRVINPRTGFGGDVSLPPTVYLTKDLRDVLDADVIVLIKGWQKSEGANREAHLGVWTGKRFMLAVDNEVVGWRFVEIDAPDFSESVRGGALDEARALITGDRNNAYGPPWQDFSRTAGAATAMGYAGPNGRPIESHDIAILVMLIKLSRLMWTPTKRDSWVDIAGYAGCGLECAIHDEEAKLSNEG